MVTANDSRRCTVARHTPNKRSLRSSFLCRLYRQHFDGPTGSSGSGPDGQSGEIAACLPTLDLMTPVADARHRLSQQEAWADDRQLGGRSILATEVGRRSGPQPAVGQFKTGKSHATPRSTCSIAVFEAAGCRSAMWQ